MSTKIDDRFHGLYLLRGESSGPNRDDLSTGSQIVNCQAGNVLGTLKGDRNAFSSDVRLLPVLLG
ncbi:hypothetical protein D3C71_1949250 [compost metagenome]